MKYTDHLQVYPFVLEAMPEVETMTREQTYNSWIMWQQATMELRGVEAVFKAILQAIDDGLSMEEFIRQSKDAGVEYLENLDKFCAAVATRWAEFEKEDGNHEIH